MKDLKFRRGKRDESLKISRRRKDQTITQAHESKRLLKKILDFTDWKKQLYRHWSCGLYLSVCIQAVPKATYIIQLKYYNLPTDKKDLKVTGRDGFARKEEILDFKRSIDISSHGSTYIIFLNN